MSAKTLPPCRFQRFLSRRIQLHELTHLAKTQSVKEKRSTMESFTSLKSSSLHTLAVEIWRIWNLSAFLTDYIYEKCKLVKCNKTAKSQAQNAYHKLLEKVIGKILTDNNIQRPYKTDVAMAFIEIEQNMYSWATKIHGYLKYKTKENIAYVLEKTTFTHDGKINKAISLIKAMFDSFVKIELESYLVSQTSLVTKKDFEQFIWSEKYVADHFWKLRKKVECEIEEMKSHETWMSKVCFLRIFHEGNPTDAQIMLDVAVTVADPDVWVHVVEKWGLASQRYFCLALVETLLYSKGPKTKQDKSDMILNLYGKLDEDLWQKILIKYFQELISVLFISSYRESSLKFYQDACFEIEERACADTLKQLLDQMINNTQVFKCEDVYFLKGKQIFLKMWNSTPVNVKVNLSRDLLEILRELLKKKEFHFMSLLINDEAFSDEQKKEFITFIILDLIGESEFKKVYEFLGQFPDKYNLNYVKANAKDTIKKYMATKQCILNYDIIFEFMLETTEKSDTFKTEVVKDKQFIIDTLASLALGGNEGKIKDLLKWVFNNDATGMNSFIDEKLINELWLVEIYKKYLSNVGSKLKYPKPLLLECLLPEAEAQLKFKRFVREDQEFVLKALDRMMKESVSSLTSFLRCIFDETEKRERARLVLRYVRSDRGINHIYNLYLSSSTTAAGYDINNEALHHRHKLNPLVHEYFKFKKHWFVCSQVFYELSWKMFSVDFVDLKRRVQEYKKGKREILLPYEDVAAFENIAKKNCALFSYIMNPDTDEPLVEEDILRKLQNPVHLFKTEDMIDDTKTEDV